MKSRCFAAFLCLVFVAQSRAIEAYPYLCLKDIKAAPTAEEMAPPPYRIGQWNYHLGNHRALLKVVTKADGIVFARIPWRRKDLFVEEKNILIIDQQTNKPVNNRVVLRCSREFADIVFEPTSGSGLYAVYYLQWHDISGYLRAKQNASHALTSYVKPQQTVNVDWFAKYLSGTPQQMDGKLATLPRVEVVAIEALEMGGSQPDYNSFYPMEVIATDAETKRLTAELAKDAGFVLFPEDRQHPIKMRYDLPYRWIRRGISDHFKADARPNEYFVYQLGCLGLCPLDHIDVQFSDLKTEGSTISKSAMTCFNEGGVDWLGRPFTKQVDVPNGRIQPLWCGIQIPEDCADGTYRGTVTVRADGQTAQSVDIEIRVSGEVLEDHGDSDLSKLSRLRWLNSTRGIDEKPVPPFTPVIREKNEISILGRVVSLADSGLPGAARSYISLYDITKQGHEILAQPVRMVIEQDSKAIDLKAESPTFTKQTDKRVEFGSQLQSDVCRMDVEGWLEFDGYMRYRVTLRAKEAVSLSDIHLDIPYHADTATYGMGKLVRNSGYLRPLAADVPIAGGIMYNAFWIGDTKAGMGCQLKNHEDQWNSDNKSKDDTPELIQWANGGKGFYRIREDAGVVTASVHTGTVDLAAGQSFELNFALLVTPFKPISRDRWNYKIYHHRIKYNPQMELAKQSGAAVINIHHGNIYNPHINYPFNASDRLRDFTAQAHSLGKRVKIYNTVRELSARCAELWAIRSLGDEILIQDPGWEWLFHQDISVQKDIRENRSGCAWICEHLVGEYRNRWHTILKEGLDPKQEKLIGPEQDFSIATQGLSRWHNYYVEGLNWLRKNTGIDGLYLDGIGYDRAVMQRVRKAMDVPGLDPAMIDFHGAVHYAWMQLAPYLDSLWFGEGARYHQGPDYWLVDVSGIPFGLTGEILGHNKNATIHRGMLFGMCRRYGWGGGQDSIDLWNLWDRLKLQNSDWMGFWEPDCPVKCQHKDIYATVYKQPGSCLVAIGSWAPKDQVVNLQIDWKTLGLDPKKVKISAPEIDEVQKAASFRVNEPVKIPTGKGLLLLIEESP